jgi:hypothetical protein
MLEKIKTKTNKVQSRALKQERKGVWIKNLFSNKYFKASILAVLAFSVLFWTISLILNFASSSYAQEKTKKELGIAGSLTVKVETPTEADINAGKFFFKVNWSGQVTCKAGSTCKFTITRSDIANPIGTQNFSQGTSWSFTHYVAQRDFGSDMGSVQKGDIYYTVTLTDEKNTVLASGNSKATAPSPITVTYSIQLDTQKAKVAWTGGFCGPLIEKSCKYKIIRSLRFAEETVIKQINYTDSRGKGEIIDEGTPTDEDSRAKLVYSVQLVDGEGNVLAEGSSTIPKITETEIRKEAASWFEQFVSDPFRKAFAAAAAAGMKALGEMIQWSTETLEKSNLLAVASPNNYLVPWTIVRDLANLIFVVILVFIAVANIVRFQIEQYSIRSALPYLVLAIFLANFSLLICGFLVDIVNNFQSYFLANKTSDFFTVTNIGLNTTTYSKVEDFISFIGFLLLAGLLFVMFLLCVLFLIIIMFARLAVIYLLAVISPLAFAAYALPGTRKYFQQWWQYFTNFLIMGPLCAFALWLASEILKAPIGVPDSFNLKDYVVYKAGWGRSDIFKLAMAGILIAAAAYIPALLGGKFFAWGSKLVTGAASAYGRFLGGKGVELATRKLTQPAGKLLTAFGAKDLGGLISQMKGFNPIRDVGAIQAMMAAKTKHAQENAQKKFMTYMGLKFAKHPALRKVFSDYGEYWADSVGEMSSKIAGSVGLLKYSLMYQDPETGKYHDLTTGKEINEYKRLERGFAAAEALRRMPDTHRSRAVQEAAKAVNAAVEAQDAEALVDALSNPALGIKVDPEKAKNIVFYDPYGDEKPKLFELAGVSRTPDAVSWCVKQTKIRANVASDLAAKIAAETGRPIEVIKPYIEQGFDLPAEIKVSPSLSEEIKKHKIAMDNLTVNMEAKIRPVLNDEYKKAVEISGGTPFVNKTESDLVEIRQETAKLLARIEINKPNYKAIINEPSVKQFLTSKLGLSPTEIQSMLDSTAKSLNILKTRARAAELARFQKKIDAKDPDIEKQIKSEAHRLWQKTGKPAEENWEKAQDHLKKVLHDNLYRQQYFPVYRPIASPEEAEKLAKEAGEDPEKQYYEEE